MSDTILSYRIFLKSVKKNKLGEKEKDKQS
jgi:hypothetical protein